MKRPCGCGERGRHKPICNLAGVTKPKVKREPRTCGCGERGRHKPTCTLSSTVESVTDVYEDKTDLESLVYSAYGKPPHLEWYPDKERQKTVENKIIKLVKRKKPFYLMTNSLATGEKELWYIDAGNWASTNGIFVGHINNCLEFLQGRHPLW